MKLADTVSNRSVEMVVGGGWLNIYCFVHIFDFKVRVLNRKRKKKDEKITIFRKILIYVRSFHYRLAYMFPYKYYVRMFIMITLLRCGRLLIYCVFDT